MLMVEAPMGLPASVVAEAIGAVPDGLPKPPAHPPAEPIIIKVPPRPHEEPEIDRPHDGEEDDGIRRVPWMPDMPPPLPPEERPCQAPGAGRSSWPEVGSSPARRPGLASGVRETYIKVAG